MSAAGGLDLVLRVAASAADSRRGIVRAHPEALVALGVREWDAIEIVGARRTAAVVAAARADAPTGLLVVDEVVAANCGRGDDGTVVVRAAGVTGAQSITVQGLPAAGRDVAERTLRSALLGKVVRVGDSVTLLPRDLGPAFPTSEATRSLRNALGAGWSTTLLTVTATEPGGTVSVQPATSVEVKGGAGAGGSASAGGSGSGGVGSGGSASGESGLSGSGGDPLTGDAPVDHGIEALPVSALVGQQEQAELLGRWLTLALDRSDLLRTLGASSHLGVVVAGPAGVGKATLVRSVAAGRRLEVLDGPSTGALEAGSRLERVAAACARVRSGGGVLLVTDVEALLPAVQAPAAPDPVSTLVLDRLRELVDAPGAALVVTCVGSESADPRLRDPELCDREIELALPNARDRAELLAAMLRPVPTGELDLRAIAERAPGYVAGDLRALIREAALRAAARAMSSGDGDVTSSGAGRGSEGSNPETAAVGAGTSPEPAAAIPEPEARIEQADLEGALSVIRPLSRSGSEELALGSVTLEDVGDMAEVRQVLTETVLWPLRHPDSFARLGVEPGRGVLLYGPPGCGKTFVVRALAASGHLTVHMVKGAELMDRWVGSSEKAVRDLFARARRSAPSLVFLDEVDALAPRRGQGADSGVADRVVASLLTELDGAEPLDGVVVIAATNRPELVDPAVLRPGRLEKLLFVPPPDADARAEILRAAGRGVPLAADVDLAAVARELDGYSAADCAALLREAALTAMRRDLDAAEVTVADLGAARRTVRPSLDPAQVENLRRYAERRG